MATPSGMNLVENYYNSILIKNSIIGPSETNILKIGANIFELIQKNAVIRLHNINFERI